MIPEESLRQAAQRAQEALLDSLPETPAAHTFSPAYRRKLARLARRMDRKPRPPHWILHRVAGILLAVVCLGGVVLGTNAQAREAFFGWIREQKADSLWYTYQGDTVPRARRWPIRSPCRRGTSWTRTCGGNPSTPRTAGMSGSATSTQPGKRSASPILGTDRWKDMAFAMEDRVARKNLRIHGSPAELYLSPEPEGRSVILWIDYATGALLEVAAPLEEADLIALAESAAPVESYFF